MRVLRPSGVVWGRSVSFGVGEGLWGGASVVERCEAWGKAMDRFSGGVAKDAVAEVPTAGGARYPEPQTAPSKHICAYEPPGASRFCPMKPDVPEHHHCR